MHEEKDTPPRSTYCAYSTAKSTWQFSFSGRDDNAGILGTLSTDAEPIAVANDLESVEQKSFAYLGCDPEPMIYVTDADLRVLRILINRKHHDVVNLQEKRIVRLVVCLVFAVTCLAMPLFISASSWLFLTAFAACVLLYHGFIHWGFGNEIEAGLMCELLLVALAVGVNLN